MMMETGPVATKIPGRSMDTGAGSPNVGNPLANGQMGSSAGPPSIGPGISNSNNDGVEKPPKWQLDLLMEKLRQKSAQLKPLGDTSKNIRQALMVYFIILQILLTL